MKYIFYNILLWWGKELLVVALTMCFFAFIIGVSKIFFIGFFGGWLLYDFIVFVVNIKSIINGEINN